MVAIGKAAELARKELPNYDKTVRPLRDSLEDGILRSIPKIELNGHKIQRLANTTNITFHGIESEALLILLDKEGICASSGSACLADSDEPSHVIKAMKQAADTSRQSIRFSLGVDNSQNEVQKTCSVLLDKVYALRS